MQDKQFKELKRKMNLSYQQDGIIDIIIDATVSGFAINMATDSSVWTILAWFPIIYYVPLKNSITVPRFGYVQFEKSCNRPSMMILAFLISGVLEFFPLGILVFLLSDPLQISPSVQWIRKYPMLFYGLILFIIFGFAGLVSKINRLYLYACISLFLLAGGQQFGTQEFIPVLLLGCVIITSGVVLLVRFLRKYPKMTEKEPNGTI